MLQLGFSHCAQFSWTMTGSTGAAMASQPAAAAAPRAVAGPAGRRVGRGAICAAALPLPRRLVTVARLVAGDALASSPDRCAGRWLHHGDAPMATGGDAGAPGQLAAVAARWAGRWVAVAGGSAAYNSPRWLGSAARDCGRALQGHRLSWDRPATLSGQVSTAQQALPEPEDSPPIAACKLDRSQPLSHSRAPAARPPPQTQACRRLQHPLPCRAVDPSRPEPPGSCRTSVLVSPPPPPPPPPLGVVPPHARLPGLLRARPRLRGAGLQQRVVAAQTHRHTVGALGSVGGRGVRMPLQPPPLAHPLPPPAVQVRCLNEAVDGSCRKVFKPWHQRMEAPSGEPGAQLGAWWAATCAGAPPVPGLPPQRTLSLSAHSRPKTLQPQTARRTTQSCCCTSLSRGL